MAMIRCHAEGQEFRGRNLAGTTTQATACTPTPRLLTQGQLAHIPQIPPLSGPSPGDPIWVSGACCPVFARVLQPQSGY
jgi:hypothetical protein